VAGKPGHGRWGDGRELVTAVSPVLQARLHGSEYQMVKLGGQAKNFDSDLILGSGLFYRLGKILKYSLHSMVESPSY
jgi:hypothetical protein